MDTSEKNLAHAFAFESINASKNAMFALKAEKEGHENEARLFRALASGQQVHAKKALMLLRGRIDTTDANISAATEALDLAIATYREVILVAAKEKAAAIESSFVHFMKTAMNHRAVLNRGGKADTAYHVCQICGFVAEGTVPARCPVCRAVPQQFETIS